MDIKKQTVGEWYKESVLGRGSFGVVTLWRNQMTSEMIALKLVRVSDDKIKKEHHRERMLNEIENIKKLSHPNIVKILQLPEEMSKKLSDNIVLICMEYCKGGDLRKVLNQPENCCGLTENTIRKLLKDMKNGIEYLHRIGIIHGDIKPENVVLQEVGDEIVYKLIDLNHQREFDQNKLYSSYIGTLQYLAPEVLAHTQSLSVDYWSFGVVCHEVITGFRPFPSDIPPLKWASLLKSKDYEDISIFKNIDGEIVFNNHLPTEHHISQFLKDEFEYWLRLTLEWDGKIRGRNVNNEIIVFSALDSILNKKIVTIFSVIAMTQLSYEVDNSTAISTLKGWIQRDTKQSGDDQLLLLPTGDKLLDESLACNCWDNTNEVAMAYVFSKTGLKLPSVELKIPALVAKIIEIPKKLYNYYTLRRIWSQAVFFIQNQLYLCSTFLEALAVKLLAILKNIEDLTATDATISSETQQTIGKIKLCNESLCLNEENYKKFCAKLSGCDKNAAIEWRKKSKILHEHLSQIYAIAKTLSCKVMEVKFNFEKAQSVHDEAHGYKEKLQNILEASYKLYQSLLTMPKELRESESNSIEMVALVNKTLEVRDTFIKDNNLEKNLKFICDCESEISNLKMPLEEFSTSVQQLNTDIVLFHNEMLQDIWEVNFSKV